MPEKDYNFLMEFIKRIKNIKIENPVEEDFTVPEWHKKIVRERLKTTTSNSFKPWSEVKKQLKHKK
ncbi:MAG TPA: hypothetical protein VD905_21920 [Flavobacteriales bacterium]|nr:hypothetical protein [Flavobacteriales bacterium]